MFFKAVMRKEVLSGDIRELTAYVEWGFFLQDHRKEGGTEGEAL
jgi:hypothetical protein